MQIRYSMLFGIWASLATFGSLRADELLPAPREKKVLEVPKDLRDSLKLDPFYRKYLDCKGIPILTSEKVSDEGILEANHLICQMLANRDAAC